MQSQSEIAMLPVDQIIDPKFLLRYVDRNSSSYMELFDSIAQNGLINSICVRPAGERAPGKYEAVDGFYRLTICREQGRETIPAIISDLSDEEVLATQIRANALRPETTKIEYARQLRRLQEFRPGITMAEMAQLVNKSPRWVDQQLDLLYLDEPTQAMVEAGEMPLQSAYMLAKVPRQLRTNELLAQACVLPVKHFAAIAGGIVKQYMEQIRNGKLHENYNDEPFKPGPYQRALKKVAAEAESPHFLPQLLVIEGAKTPLQGAIIALNWTMNLDRDSVIERRKLYEKQHRKPDLKKLYEREPDELANE